MERGQKKTHAEFNLSKAESSLIEPERYIQMREEKNNCASLGTAYIMPCNLIIFPLSSPNEMLSFFFFILIKIYFY